MHSCFPVFAGTRQDQGETSVQQLAYSINDTAKTLSLGRTSIYALINEGRLEAFKLGRRTLVKADSIRRLIEAQG